jgi:xylan 1,4-beta-xylosidase
MRLALLAYLTIAGAARLVVAAESSAARPAQPETYCNPLNLDYGYCPIPNFVEQGKHRATADPSLVIFRGDYYLFSTNQWGYWWSPDLGVWNFVPRKFLKPQHQVYDELCAPAAFVMDDLLHVVGSTHTPDFPIWRSAAPRGEQGDRWEEAIPAFAGAAWDPAFFLDDDDRLYLYHGSSNDHPLYGQEIDRKTLQPIGPKRELIRLDDERHGWERFGEANDNTFLRPFIEGAWMTKHAGRYYLQYAAPGTEFSGYADGVYVGEHPLGPFEYQPHNPICFKPGGFARGAGHGSTFQDKRGEYWRCATIVIGVKNNFERRLGIWPAGFDADGVMNCDTAYGDYPQRLPDASTPGGAHGERMGWMLLNYAKPVVASSTLGGFAPNLAVDEDIKTYWSAATGDPGEQFTSDLGELSTVHAIQINYADQDAELMGKVAGIAHQYVISASLDGQTWNVIVDKSNNQRDVSHDYVELPTPVKARFVRIENRGVPTGKFSLSGLRVFGRGRGAPPQPVQNFIALRGDSEPRNAWLKWRQSRDATGYVIRCGVDPQKLYNSVMVYGANEYYFRAMDRDVPYYFQIEAFNENGVSPRTTPVVAD